MVKKSVTIQERLEQLIAGAGANPDGPALDVAGLQAHVTRLNELEYAATQARLALAAAVKARDENLAQFQEETYKGEYAVKAFYGPRSPKVQEYILPGVRVRAPKTPSAG